MSTKYRAQELADYLRHLPRDDRDLEAAKMLEAMSEVYEVAKEMVFARTHEHSRAAYAEMIDLIKSKRSVDKPNSV